MLVIPTTRNLAAQSFRLTVNETEVFTFDFSDRLITGETITSSAQSVPAGVTEVNQSESATQTQITVTSTTPGIYVIESIATTSNNRLLEANGFLRVL